MNPEFDKWYEATTALPWGTQRAFQEVLKAAADGSTTTLVYNADYRNEGACLVNQAGAILSSGGGKGIPTAQYGAVVSAFDQINRHLETSGVNDRKGYVSPLAAEILLQYFGEVKPSPLERKMNSTVENAAFANHMDVEKDMFVEPANPDEVKLLTEAFSEFKE